MVGEKTLLSSSVNVAQYRALEAAADRRSLGKFIVERFCERYFRPITDSKSKHGFAGMAIACLVIETLESFYQGLPDTDRASKQMFRDFFARDSCLKVFAGGNDWFFKDIRCGILHQSETRGGWRVLRSGPLLDTKRKTINATAVLRGLKCAVEQYATNLQTDEKLWNKFTTKMKAVCDNCQ
jgi:hypothetical protein